MTQHPKTDKAVRIALIAVTSALMLPAANAQPTEKPAGSAMQHPMGSSSSMSKDSMDMKAMMKSMHEKMSPMQMSGKPDIDFAMAMRVHHEGAIQMAEVQLREGKEPQMRILAKDIIYAQKKEIAQIDRFLASHGHPAGAIRK